MEIVGYIILWELGCFSIVNAGIYSISRKSRKLGFFLLTAGIAFLVSMFIILFSLGFSFIALYPLTFLLLVTFIIAMLLFKRKKGL